MLEFKNLNSKFRINKIHFILLVCLQLTIFVQLSFSTNYYISNAGNDSNSGLNKEKSWQSIDKINSYNFNAGDSILFKKSDTFYGALIIHNSGSLSNPIVFSSYGIGDNPILTGFTVVNDWNDLGGNIWESSSAVSSLELCNMVVVNGNIAPIGRYPNSDDSNSGYLTIDSQTGKTSIASSDLTGGENWTGATLVLRTRNWIIETIPILSQTSNKITIDQNKLYSEPNDGSGFFIQNDSRTLDKQNEWYYNPSTKKLKIYSTYKPYDVKVASLDDLVTYKGHYILINDLTFEGANRYCFFSDWTHDHTIKNCSVLFSGLDAVNLAACTNFKFDNNIVLNTNSGALNLYNANDYATITNNTIMNTGTIVGMGRSGEAMCNYTAIYLSANSDNGFIGSNKILNTGYIGIYFHGNSTIVKNNLINTFCTVLQDGGGIYTWRGLSSIKTGQIIDQNIVLNGIGAPIGTNSIHTSANGIYIDDNSRNVVITNNTVTNCKGNGIFIHNSSHITISNNTVFNNNIQLYTQDDPTYDKIVHCYIQNNNFISISSDQLLFNLITRDALIEDIGVIDNNIYSSLIDLNPIFRIQPNGWSNPIYNYNFSDWKTYIEQDVHSFESPYSITSEDEILFRYNTTLKDSTLYFPNNVKMDVRGNIYRDSIILKPFTSAILIKAALDSFTVELNTGWNLFSFCVVPESIDISFPFQEIINDDNLVKIQDEKGRTIEYFGDDQGWKNSIGELSIEEGYQIHVLNPCRLTIAGYPIHGDITSDLSKGWNIIPYNRKLEQDALQVLNSLLQQGVLVEVRDEADKSIKKDNNNNWVNAIGNFIPGKAYKIKVNTDCQFVLKIDNH